MPDAVLHKTEGSQQAKPAQNDTTTAKAPNLLRNTLPEALTQSIQAGVQLLEGRLRCSLQEAKTHRLILIEGWGEDAATIDAIAAYFVGLLATAVARALQVRAQLENTQRDRVELLSNVEAIVGSRSSPLDPKQKTDERNPWMAEGLWHLCLLLSSRRLDLHPPGQVIALDFPHIAAKDHGFDVVALYDAGGAVGFALVESKAYENNPNGAVNDAVKFYKEFDNGRYDARARQTVAALREALPAERQVAISPSLWKDIRAYLPNPHYDATVEMDWTNSRHSLKTLAVGREQIVIMPHAVKQFAAFFDAVGESMLKTAEALPIV